MYCPSEIDDYRIQFMEYANVVDAPYFLYVSE